MWKEPTSMKNAVTRGVCSSGNGILVSAPHNMICCASTFIGGSLPPNGCFWFFAPKFWEVVGTSD